MVYTFEVAVDSVESALTAQKAGANRIELCAGLAMGGITPSHSMIAVAHQYLNIPINVMIRPRRGDFLYSDIEFEIMQRDIDYTKSLNVNGVVLGILKSDGSVDIDRTRILIEQARPLKVTFHRAFDMTVDPFQALDNLMMLGVDTVLTSGQQDSAVMGLSLIADLIRRAGTDIKIMPGAGITPDNIRKIVEGSSTTEFHFSGKATVDSLMQYRQPNLPMSNADQLSEYQLIIADEATIRAIIRNVIG